MQINFKNELSVLLNKYGKDNECNTPDFILANYLIEGLRTLREVARNSAANAVENGSTHHEINNES